MDHESNSGGKKLILKTTIWVLVLLLLLLSAFVVYTFVKIKTRSSVSFHHPAKVRNALLYQHVEHLSVTIGSRSVSEYDELTAAREYILTSLTNNGYAPVRQDYSYEDRIYSNVIVTIPGKANPEEIVLIGAHYDTKAGTPGADDNASAVAVLLEMCRLLKNETPDRTLKLVFFTLEEPPIFGSKFMGSAVYARKARSSQENIIAMISLEMLGYYSDRKDSQSYPLPLMNLFYPTTADFIHVIGNFRSRKLVNRIATSMRKTGGIGVETLAMYRRIPGIDFSDHRSFWNEKYLAVIITDTGFYRNPNYHTDNDTVGTLDFNRMNVLLQALVQMAKDLGKKT